MNGRMELRAVQGAAVVVLAGCAVILGIDDGQPYEPATNEAGAADGGGPERRDAGDAGAHQYAVWAGVTLEGGAQNAQTFIAEVLPGGALGEWKEGPSLENTPISGIVGDGSNLYVVADMRVFFTSMTAPGVLAPFTPSNSLASAVRAGCPLVRGRTLYVIAGTNTENTAYASILPDHSVGGWLVVGNLMPGDASVPIASVGAFPDALVALTGTPAFLSSLTDAGVPTQWRPTDSTPLSAQVFSSLHVTLATSGERLYQVGGYRGSSSSPEVFYATRSGDGGLVWTSTQPYARARQNPSAVAIGDYLYVAGGESVEVEVAHLAPIGGADDGWKRTTSLPRPVGGRCRLATVSSP